MREKIIYLVDDDEDDRMLIREAMEDAIDGIEIIECIDGEMLLESIRHHGHNSSSGQVLIMMDMSMPRLNGLETLTRLKADPLLENIPVLMVSTASNGELVSDAYATGVNGFIRKPVLVQEFQQMAEGINDSFFNNYQHFQSGRPEGVRVPTDVLFIDDNKDHWEMIDMALRHSVPGVKAVGTSTFSSTMDLLRSRLERYEAMPQVIFMDLYMPTRQDGLKLLDAIRKFQLEYHQTPIPVVIVSSSEHKDDIHECYRHKANAYMVKSLDLSQWLNYFRELCNFWCRTITLPPAIAYS